MNLTAIIPETWQEKTFNEWIQSIHQQVENNKI